MISTGDRPMTVREAYDALEAFAEQAGRLPLLLLLHVAVAQSFRADLLNLVKTNFLAQEAGTDLTVDADVLLSPLVERAAAGYYRLDPEVRRHALALLDAAYRHESERRTVQVARLVLAYADAVERDAGQALDPLLGEYLAVQRWVALAFVDPPGAAEAFAKALAESVPDGRVAASLRLGSVTAAMSIPLEGQRELLAYAQGVEALATGDEVTGQRLLDLIGGDVQIGGVTLRAPTRRLADRTVTTDEPARSADSEFVFISYSVGDRESVDPIVEVLRRAGIRVWMAPANLDEGERSYDRQIDDAIDRCALFVPILSFKSLKSRACRREWERAIARATSLPHVLLLCPMALEPVGPENVPREIAVINWLFVEDRIDESRDRIVQHVNESLARNRRPPLRFGILSPPVPMIGRTVALGLIHEWWRNRTPGTSAAFLPIAGPDGSGKWTLASHAAAELGDRFPDGVIWFGEDGNQYPTAALRAWADAAGVTDLFGPGNEAPYPDRQRFSAVFTDRRVLFVADQRTASDIVPVLRTAGPGCVVLSLLPEARDDGGLVITLDPLGDDAARELLSGRSGGQLGGTRLLEFARGNPLVLRLVAGAAAMWSEKDLEAHIDQYATVSDGDWGNPRAAWVVEFMWKQGIGTILHGLASAIGGGTLISIAAPLAETSAENLDALEKLGLINRHGSFVRVPPGVAIALRELEHRTAGETPASESTAAPADEIPPVEPALELLNKGELDAAQARLEERLRRCERAKNQVELAITLALLGDIALRKNDLDTAYSLQARRREGAAAVQDLRDEASAMLAMSTISRRRGRLAEALELVQGSIAMYQRLDDPRGQAMALRAFGSTLRLSGREQEAIEALQQALQTVERIADPDDLALRLQTLGELSMLYFNAGQTEHARRVAHERIALADSTGQPETQIDALTVAGEIDARSGSIQEGESLLARAVELAERVGRADMALLIQSTLAWIRAATGDLPGALERLQALWPRATEVLANRAELATIAERYGIVMLATGNRAAATPILERARAAYGTSVPELTQRLDELLETTNSEDVRAEIRRWIRWPARDQARTSS